MPAHGLAARIVGKAWKDFLSNLRKGGLLQEEYFGAEGKRLRGRSLIRLTPWTERSVPAVVRQPRSACTPHHHTCDPLMPLFSSFSACCCWPVSSGESGSDRREGAWERTFRDSQMPSLTLKRRRETLFPELCACSPWSTDSSSSSSSSFQRKAKKKREGARVLLSPDSFLAPSSRRRTRNDCTPTFLLLTVIPEKKRAKATCEQPDARRRLLPNAHLQISGSMNGQTSLKIPFHENGATRMARLLLHLQVPNSSSMSFRIPPHG